MYSYLACGFFRFNFYFYSAGGLVTAVAPVVIKGNGLWVGWPGIHSKEPLGEIPESDPSDQTPTAGLRSDQVKKIVNLNKINNMRCGHLLNCSMQF